MGWRSKWALGSMEENERGPFVNGTKSLPTPFMTLSLSLSLSNFHFPSLLLPNPYYYIALILIIFDPFLLFPFVTPPFFPSPHPQILLRPRLSASSLTKVRFFFVRSVTPTSQKTLFLLSMTLGSAGSSVVGEKTFTPHHLNDVVLFPFRSFCLNFCFYFLVFSKIRFWVCVDFARACVPLT